MNVHLAIKQFEKKLDKQYNQVDNLRLKLKKANRQLDEEKLRNEVKNLFSLINFIFFFSSLSNCKMKLNI